MSSSLALILFGISAILPTYFTRKKWIFEKESGVFGPTWWDYMKMWFWIWLATSAAISGLVAVFI
jgi:hypothetical protein